MKRSFVIGLSLLGALALAACGDDPPPPTPDEPPAQLLNAALANPVSSGEAKIELDFELQGDSILAGPLSARLDGPFAADAEGSLPSFDLSLDGSVAGFGIDGELVSTGEDVFVVFFGENYRVGEAAVAGLEQRLRESVPTLQLEKLFVDPRYEGAEEVAGAQTERISATLDSAAAARYFGEMGNALGALAPISALAEGAGAGTIDAWIAFDDQTIRRLNVRFPFTVPTALLPQSQGIAGGTAGVRVELSDVGADVEIERPEGGGFQPIEDLIRRLQSLASLGL